MTTGDNGSGRDSGTGACADYGRRRQPAALWLAAMALSLGALGCGSQAEATSAGAEAASGDETPAAPLPPVEPAPLAADIATAVAAVIEAPHRSDKHIARNVHRHPAETLAFMGLRQDMTVIELWPGGGWYTGVLAPVLRGRGKLVVGDSDPTDKRWGGGIRRLVERMAKQRDVYGDVEVARLAPPGSIELGPDASADMVLTFRNVHNWMHSDSLSAVFADAFRVLKPGGVFGVVEHRAAEGSDPAVSAKKGYVSEAYVIAIAEGVGFTLDARSEINANPKDTRDHPKGVWTLPPVLSLKDQDRDRWLAIGESDRMTLRFVKPGGPAAVAPPPPAAEAADTGAASP